MGDKRSKMWGEPVSKEEVLKELGDPAGWFANAKKVEFRHRLRKGQDDLDISGIRGYGRIGGYLDFLRKESVHPLGTGTGLVSPEKDAEILRAAQAEISEEIRKYEARLVELERSPQAVSDYIASMKWWLSYLVRLGALDPELEPFDELKESARQENENRESEMARLQADIARYEKLLQDLQA